MKSKIDIIVGTRPDAIKMKPLIQGLKSKGWFDVRIISTGQHADLLPMVFRGENYEIDHDLRVMSEGQDTKDLISKILTRYGERLKTDRPDLVLVHGDTASAFGAAMAAFYQRIDIGHVEAGLRSEDLYSPHPEEGHRRMISQVARYHFATDEISKRRLSLAGIKKENIFVTGNTIHNALNSFRRNKVHPIATPGQTELNLLLTVHRAEKSLEDIREMFGQIQNFLKLNPDSRLRYVLHPRPDIREMAKEQFYKNNQVELYESQSHEAFLNLLESSDIILTDSGGVQEESVYLKKKVLLLRSRTERTDGMAEGLVRLIDPQYIFNELSLAQLQLKNRGPLWPGKCIDPVKKITDILSQELNQVWG